MNKDEEVLNAIKPIMNARKTHKDNHLYSLQLNAYQLDAIQGLLDLYNKEKEKNKKIENYCRGDLAFERRLIRINQEPDMFNQGRFYTSQNIINIICEKAEEKEE